jgi:hypothetical protein
VKGVGETPAAPLDFLIDCLSFFLLRELVSLFSHSFSTVIPFGYIPISAALADNPLSVT